MTHTVRDLPVVDGLRLPDDLRALLRPDDTVADRFGRLHRLRVFFTRCEAGRRRRNCFLPRMSA